MQMLLVWNLTEIDVNEPDKVLIVIKVACEYNIIVSITLSRQLTFPVNINLQTVIKRLGWVGEVCPRGVV